MPLLLIIIIYQLLQIIALPIIVVLLATLHIKRKIIGNLWQRLGIVPLSTHSTHRIFWIHAVSVGETLSVEHFIKRLKSEFPNARCYLTVGTIAGKRIAQSHVTAADWISYLPYDFLPCIMLAYHRIKPSVVFIAESELWPNFIATAYYKKIPLIWLNARINPYSRTRFVVFRRILRPLITCFSHIFAQSSYDQEEFQTVGIKAKRIDVLGNIKVFNVIEKKADYTTKKPEDCPNSTNQLRIILAGSIHPGEDTLYLDAFATLKTHFQNLKLILAPRHFGWQQTLEDHVTQRNLTYTLWNKQSKLDDAPLPTLLNDALIDHDVLLVCTLGRLFQLYPHAEIYALGGTFIPVGGHNLLESAVWGVPTLIGPYYQNCKDIAERLEALQGIIKIHNQETLYPILLDLLKNPEKSRAVGSASKLWIEEENQFVVQKLGLLSAMLQKPQ